MSKARDLANLISAGSALADGVVQASEISGTLSVTQGGTGATTSSTALNNLGGTTLGRSIALTLIFGT